MRLNLVVLAVLPSAAVLTAGIVAALRPLLVRYALARPTARGLHATSTPQGGGIAVVLAAIVAGFGAAFFLGIDSDDFRRLAVLAVAALALALLGGIDDIRPLPAALRLASQLAVAAVAVSLLPTDLRILPGMPVLIERAVLVIGLTWFVNLTNFMDGMDWMTVAEIVPVAAALFGFAAAGALPPWLGLLMLALAGGMIGFAPFNAPVARLFLGDVGSLPTGLLVGYALIELAARGAFAAALLLPLYYIADSSLTLLWRAWRRQPIWQAHREHFYQRAALRGTSALSCVTRVFGVNVVLAGLAALTYLSGSATVTAAALLVGFCLVGLLLRSFVSVVPRSEYAPAKGSEGLTFDGSDRHG